MTIKAPNQYETYLHFVGSGALSYGWYTGIADNSINIHINDEAGHDGWAVTFTEKNTDAQFTLDHSGVMAAVRLIDKRPGMVTRRAAHECYNLLNDRDAVDFDSDTADQVIQIAAFGEIRYS